MATECCNVSTFQTDPGIPRRTSRIHSSSPKATRGLLRPHVPVIHGVRPLADAKGMTVWCGSGRRQEMRAITPDRFEGRSIDARRRRATMTEYEFTLVIEGDLEDERAARALFEVGCDDATFGVVDGVGYGDFAREGSSFAEAVLGAISQVEMVDALRVLRVEPDNIVTMSDIAERLDRTRESVRLLVAGRRGPGGFPSPISHAMERGRLWRWSDVAAWLGQLEPEEIEAARFVSAINAALELRKQLSAMQDDLAVKQLRMLID